MVISGFLPEHYSLSLIVHMGQSIQEWTKKRLASTKFAWSNPEYFAPYIALPLAELK